jgi:hypothetical protein
VVLGVFEGSGWKGVWGHFRHDQLIEWDH